MTSTCQVTKIGNPSRGDDGRTYRMYTVRLPGGAPGYFAASDVEVGRG